MRKFILCLLLGALLGITFSPLLAQQNQNTQKSNPEVESLEERVSELEEQLQTVENVEKIDLQARLAEANTKLANAEFDKFEGKLRDSNNQWLQGWGAVFVGVIGFFVVVIGGVGAVFWFWLRSTADQLIAAEVEKSLNGFKEAVDAQNVIKSEIRVLKKEHAASVLEDFHYLPLNEEYDHPEQIKSLSEEDFLQVFDDEKYDLALRYKAAEVLAGRKSSQLVPLLLEFLNSVVDSNSNINFQAKSIQRGFVNLLGHIYTQEAYQGLKKFLNRLLVENPQHKDVFLTWTVFALGWVSVELDIRDSVPILRKAIPHLKDLQYEHDALSNLVGHFDSLNEPEAIKEILTNHVTDESSGMEEVEDRCLELLQKYDPEFVNEWRSKKMTNNSNA